MGTPSAIKRQRASLTTFKMKLRIALGVGAIGASCLAAPTPHGDAGAIVPEGVRATAHLMSLHQDEKKITTTVKYEGVEAPVQDLKRVLAPAKCVETKVAANSIRDGDLIYVEGHPSYVTDKWVKDGFVTIKTTSAVEGQSFQITENEDTEFEIPKQFSGEYYIHIVKAPAGSSIKQDTVELTPKDGSTKLVVPDSQVAGTAWDNMMYPTSDDGQHHHAHSNMPLMSVTYLCGHPGKGIHVLEVSGHELSGAPVRAGNWTNEAD